MKRISFVVAFGVGVSLLSVVHAQSQMRIPDITVQEGATGISLPIHASHSFALSGYSFSVKYDPSELEVTSITFAGTSVEPLDTPDNAVFWNGSHNAVLGEIAYGVVLDLEDPLDSLLPASSDDTVVLLRMNALASAPATSAVAFLDGLGTFFPINNLLVDQDATPVDPTLVSGSVTIQATPPPLSANAGFDQTAAEGSTITLNGTLSTLGVGFSWRQLAGAQAVALTPTTIAQPQFALPEVSGDQSLLFELTVNGTQGEAPAVDTVQVNIIDRSLRTGTFVPNAGASRLLSDGRALLFQGELEWSTGLEAATWSRIVFTAGGADDESRALGAFSLFVDDNNNGTVDENDRQLGSPQEVSGDNGTVAFTFTDRVSQGQARRFFLVATVKPQSAAAGLWPFFLIAIGGGGLLVRALRSRVAVVRCDVALRFATSALVFALALLPSGCGGGGGGGGGGGAPVTGLRRVQFGIQASGDVTLQGTLTGVPAVIGGLPASGGALEV